MSSRQTLTPLKRRRTKVVATIGPASSSAQVLERLMDRGVNVFRLNMSHGDHTLHRAAFDLIRTVAAERNEPVAVLADLCGPKIRVGRFEHGEIELKNGELVTVTTRDVVGHSGLIPSQYDGLAHDVSSGCRILLSDGLMELRVLSVEGTEVFCQVTHGGTLKNRKGINLPGVEVSAPSLTERDREDARFALEMGVDFLALSFVRRAADVVELRSLFPPDHPAHIIAKIERPEAVDEIDEILDVSDGIMVARGDLGVELPPEEVPIIQRRLIAAARSRNKPSIVATQMLESMIEHPQPTRAEVSDVANAVISGADAVMLSAETAAGRFPVEAVEMMDRVARHAESYLWADGAFGRFSGEDVRQPPVPLHVAIARSTGQLSRDLRVRGIVVFSSSGTTAGIVSSARPAAPVVAATVDAATCRRMCILWGVVPMLVGTRSLQHPRSLARRLTRELGLAETGDHILTVAGFGARGAENAPAVTVLTV